MTYEEAIRGIPPGRYRHFKGGAYEVLGIARHSETEEPMVIYRALYGERQLWIRPAEMWLETVERDGKTMRRFEREATDRFIVFDVETPNRLNDRISAMGITVVEDVEIVDEYYYLVNPETWFDSFNIRLTGIDEDAVRGEMNFPQLWEQIEPVMSSGVLVAHNAPFDLSVLRRCLSDYGIFWKDKADYLCTVQMSRRMHPGMKHNLNVMCDYYGIELDHHNAGSDACACAQILLRMMGEGAEARQFLKKYDM